MLISASLSLVSTGLLVLIKFFDYAFTLLGEKPCLCLTTRPLHCSAA